MSVWRELWQALWLPRASAREVGVAKERSLVFDVLAEGQAKHTIHLLTEFDATSMRRQLSEQESRCSVTAYVAKALVCALQEQPHMQAYLKGPHKKLIFDEIDVAFMVERDIGPDEQQPLHFIIRDAARLSLAEMHTRLQAAKTLPIGGGGPLSALELAFFRLPRCLRRPVWFWIRHDPYTHKQLLGTVGITSMGMHAQGDAVVQPLTPMSLTLSIGGSYRRGVLREGRWEEHEFIRLNLSADHAVIDGAPLMRFATRLRQWLESGLQPDSPQQA